MRRVFLTVLVILLYAVHQDFWFWRTSKPMLFALLPVGLSYHALYSVAASLLMWMLVKHAWPSHLEDEAARESASLRVDPQEDEAF